MWMTPHWSCACFTVEWRALSIQKLTWSGPSWAQPFQRWASLDDVGYKSLQGTCLYNFYVNMLYVRNRLCEVIHVSRMHRVMHSCHIHVLDIVCHGWFFLSTLHAVSGIT